MVMKLLTVVLVCAAAGGAIGGLSGYVIGKQYPDAYRRLHRRYPDYMERGAQKVEPLPQPNPVDVGVGLGVPQGMMLGGFLGVLVAAIIAWHDVRIGQSSNRTQTTIPADRTGV